jgi:hypothetical protein
MADRIPSKPHGWFYEPQRSAVRRAVGIGITWAYVAGLAAVTMIVLAALVALAVAGIVYLIDFSNREMEFDAIMRPTVVVAWIVLPLGAAATVWASAYASTRSQSILRGLAGVVAMFASGLLMWGTQSTAIGLLPLALGWAIAIPVGHPGRIGVRLILPVLAVIFFPTWPGMSVLSLVIWLAIGPALAGGLTLLGDLGWTSARWMRGKSEAEMVARAPSTEDV